MVCKVVHQERSIDISSLLSSELIWMDRLIMGKEGVIFLQVFQVDDMDLYRSECLISHGEIDTEWGNYQSLQVERKEAIS